MSFRWTYAFARMTWAPVEAKYQGRLVWKVGYWDRVPDPSRPYVVFKNEIPKGSEKAGTNRNAG